VIAKPFRSRFGHSCAGVLLIAAGTTALAARPRAPQSDPYRALPSTIRATVTQRGCRPPRRSDADAFAVARGFFFASPRSSVAPNDWAVLCVRSDSAEILVFRDKQTVPEALPQWARTSRIPDDSGSVQLCEGAIARLTPPLLSSIVRNGTLADSGSLNAAERRAPTHDGIVDGDCEGVAVIHYWIGSRWVILPGSD
jgi:hypothetical protein